MVCKHLDAHCMYNLLEGGSIAFIDSQMNILVPIPIPSPHCSCVIHVEFRIPFWSYNPSSELSITCLLSAHFGYWVSFCGLFLHRGLCIWRVRRSLVSLFNWLHTVNILYLFNFHRVLKKWINLYVCIYVHIYVYICCKTSVEIRKQNNSLHLLRHGLSCSCCCAVYFRLTDLHASSQFSYLSLPYPYKNTGVTDVHHCTWLSVWVLGLKRASSLPLQLLLPA